MGRFLRIRVPFGALFFIKVPYYIGDLTGAPIQTTTLRFRASFKCKGFWAARVFLGVWV